MSAPDWIEFRVAAWLRRRAQDLIRRARRAVARWRVADFCVEHPDVELIREGAPGFPQEEFEARFDVEARCTITLSYQRVLWCPKCGDGGRGCAAFKSQTRIV